MICRFVAQTQPLCVQHLYSPRSNKSGPEMGLTSWSRSEWRLCCGTEKCLKEACCFPREDRKAHRGILDKDPHHKSTKTAMAFVSSLQMKEGLVT